MTAPDPLRPGRPGICAYTRIPLASGEPPVSPDPQEGTRP